VIVVDTSALLAILFDEPASASCIAALKADPNVYVSGGTLAEALIVVSHRGGFEEMVGLVEDLGIIVEPVTATAAERVGAAHARWGKGVHPAGLNFGDCFAYALVKEFDCPLLYIGDDFARTDVKSALS
jgi:ribonuclease VapC